jgi:uncharacterized protein
LTLVLGCVCVAFASIVGGATGFGTALVATPLMLLVGLSVPQVVFVSLVVGLVTRCAVTFRLRTHVMWSRVGLFALGSVPGAWAGAEVLHVLPVHYLKIAAGVLAVLCGISMVAVPNDFAATDRLSAIGDSHQGSPPWTPGGHYELPADS